MKIQTIALPQVGVKGLLRLEFINKFSGKTTYDSGWFENKILDSGRARLGEFADYLDYAQLGFGQDIPSAGDTGLYQWAAGTATIEENFFGAQGSSPYYGYRQKRFRFPPGQPGNLNEAGVGWGQNAGANLFTRELIRNAVDGPPVTVSPQADEYVDLSYQLRYYPPLTPTTNPPTVFFDGAEYSYILQAASVTNADAWGKVIGRAAGFNPDSDWVAYDDDIGAITGAPTGNSTQATSSTYTNDNYTGTYQRGINMQVAPTDFNLGGGLRSVLLYTNLGAYQIEFRNVGDDSPIPKTSLYQMVLAFTLGWTEATIP